MPSLTLAGNSKGVISYLQEFGVPEMIGKDNIICKMEPYNLCYTVDEHGEMQPLGDHRPVRLLRIYK